MQKIEINNGVLKYFREEKWVQVYQISYFSYLWHYIKFGTKKWDITINLLWYVIYLEWKKRWSDSIWDRFLRAEENNSIKK